RQFRALGPAGSADAGVGRGRKCCDTLVVDFRLFHWINRFQAHTGWAHGFFRLYAKDGVVLFAVVLLAGWWVSRSRRDLAGVAGSVWAAIAALVGLAANQVIGSAVDRARPYANHPGVHLLVSPTKDFSFPSD